MTAVSSWTGCVPWSCCWLCLYMLYRAPSEVKFSSPLKHASLSPCVSPQGSCPRSSFRTLGLC
jgi:hypothetical protein